LVCDGGEVYCRCVIAAIGAAGTTLFMIAALVWAARLVHVGNLDALALAQKVSPTRCEDGRIELRRRQSMDRVRGFLVAEDAPRAGARRYGRARVPGAAGGNRCRRYGVGT